ncbi:MAG: diguanylate cyclase, partial [Pseudomonadota bacterium]
MRAEEIDDPFSELSASACNLLADSIGVRYCGFATLDRAVVRAASSEFMRLPRSARDQTVRAICRVVADAQSGEDEISSDVLMRAPADDAVGGTTVALFFPETEMVAFAVEPPGREVALSPFRRAAVSALPIIYKASDLQVERHRLVEEHGLLAHVGSLAKIGGWEQNIGTGRLTWSPELFAIHGLEPHGDITLDRMLALYPSPAREKLSLEMERAASEGTGFDLTTPLTTPGGDRRVVRTLGRTRVGPTGRQLYGIAQDVTQELAVERRLWWAANHDPVTSLPNRLLFQDRIAVAIRRARREERTLALVLVEVSDFARLTERSGYTVPDKNMMEIADRLVSVMRESDTIARISIDEFAILLSDVDSEELLGPAMDRLNSQFAEMRREEVTGDGLVMSVGIAFFPTHASSEEELLRAGEMALARAKRKLDQGVVVFDQELADDAARRRETVLAQARESLKKGEFVPYYQPQIDIDTNEVVGVEALVRWRTPDMILDAKDFAYALDDHEIGSRVGRAVLDQVIADIARLRAITDRPFRVSVNASRTEVLRNDFL